MNDPAGPEHSRHTPANEMHALVEAFDWPSTPLGTSARWPQSLMAPVNILLTSRFAMWMGWGPSLTFLYNDAYARMTLGKKHPWALGRPASEVWAEIWKDIGPRIEQVMATGVATWDEALLLFLERSGFAEETYHTFSYSPLAADDGSIAGMLCVVVEETERVIGERRLASLRDLAAALSETTTEARVLDATVRVVAANGRDLPFALIYLFDEDAAGASVAHLAGQAGIDPKHPAAAPDSWPATMMLTSRSAIIVDDLAARFGAIPTGSWDIPPQRAVVVPIAEQGQERAAGFLVAGLNPYRPFDAAYAGFVNLAAGQFAASIGNARAYETERRRAEALAEIDRAKTQFFSNVSHEFRTPLTLMLGPAEEMLSDVNTLPENRERIDVVHRNALRLLKLVNTLLDFSRIEADRMEAAYEATDLAAFTADLASSFRSAMDGAGLRLIVDCPPLGEPVYVDRDMWEKIVLNLLSNAFKHTFEGEVTIRLRRAARSRAVELSVADTGIGVAADQLPQLFERFHRVPNARSRTHEGTGIGLALVRELVRLHDGSIDVASTEGVGTTFTVTIPFGNANTTAQHASVTGELDPMQLSRQVGRSAYTAEALRWLPGETEAQDADIVEGGASARILLVDDNADMRDYAARLLRTRGWAVITAADGNTALATVLETKPDLVLSDVMMPGLDGFGLVRALRAREETRTTPVILLSARAGEEARVEGLDSGADDYLVKPFGAQELLARVGSHLSLSRARADANAAVKLARDLLTDVLEQAPVAVCVLRGPEHVFELTNPFYRQLTGNRDLIGRRFVDAFPETEAQGLIATLDSVYQTGVPFVGQSIPIAFDRLGDGVIRSGYFNFTSYPFVVDGRVDGIITVATEITKEVEARHEAEAARQDAESANRAKSDFLAAMSHELRTPLNAIGGYVQLLEMELHGPITEAQRTALSRVRRSEQHLLSLITDVLNFAKLEAGRVEYDVRETQIADVVAEALAFVEPQLEARGIRFVLGVSGKVTAMADAEKLRQILLNLISNAAKFTPKGGTVTVDIADRRESGGQSGDYVFLRVVDTGIGIPREKQDAIFDPFVQVHRDLKNPTEGTGLGLAISRDLARGMGGELRVRSTEGRGATFTVSLRRRPL